MKQLQFPQVSSALLLPYFASSGHRPRWMGSGAALFSLATLLCASPHFLLPPNNLNNLNNIEINSSIKYCFDNYTTAECSRNENTSQDQQQPHYLLFAVLGAALLSVGLGQTAVYTLGIPYLDDNVASRDSPLYFCKFRQSHEPLSALKGTKSPPGPPRPRGGMPILSHDRKWAS